jgi:hypothetical protein
MSLTTRRLSAYGLSCAVLPGWDIRIERREQSEVPAPGSDLPMGGFVHPILQAGTSPMPARRGDYGSGYVERMTTTTSSSAWASSTTRPAPRRCSTTACRARCGRPTSIPTPSSG